MPDELKVNVSEMRSKAEDIKSAVGEFEGFGMNPFSNEIVAVSKMNTDFTAKLIDMLENLNNSNPDLCSLLNDIADLTKDVADKFADVDGSLASQLEVNQTETSK